MAAFPGSTGITLGGAVPAWPTGVPQNFVAQGYSEVMDECVVRDQPQVGPAIVRKIAAAGVTVISGTMVVGVLSVAQTLQYFYQITCQRGLLVFSFPLGNVTVGTASGLAFTGIEDITGLEDVAGMEDLSGGALSGSIYMRWRKAPKWTCAGDGLNWSASVVLEALP